MHAVGDDAAARPGAPACVNAPHAPVLPQLLPPPPSNREYKKRTWSLGPYSPLTQVSWPLTLPRAPASWLQMLASARTQPAESLDTVAELWLLDRLTQLLIMCLHAPAGRTPCPRSSCVSSTAHIAGLCAHNTSLTDGEMFQPSRLAPSSLVAGTARRPSALL